MARRPALPPADSAPELYRAFIDELDDELEDGFTDADAAAAVEVSPATLSEWLARKSKPKTGKRKAIDLWSNGRIPEASWDTKEERAALGRIVPAKKTG